MENFNITLERYHLENDMFKLKPLTLILNSIGGSRLNNMIQFNSYAKLSFDKDDLKKEFALIETVDSFVRNKVNALIFDINSNVTSKYTKLLIFHSEGHTCGFYHYILFNPETNESIHKYYIEHLFDSLVIAINKVLYRFNRNDNNRLMYI